MNYYKIKSNQIVCFSKSELSMLFEVVKKSELIEETIKQSLSFDDLKNDYSKMEKLANLVGERGARHRDEHEIFAALFIFLDFYEAGSEICFKLRDDFNPSKGRITSLKDLNRFRADPPDFIIKSKDGFRQFEFKRYRDGLNTEEVFNFIKKKVAHYGNDLGDMNLLLVLQSSAYDVSTIDFHELNARLKSLNLKFQGQILISYNENNTKMVINQVHPELITSRIPFKLPSTKLQHEI